MIDLGNFFYTEPVRMQMLYDLDEDYRAISSLRGVDRSFCVLVDKNFPEMWIWHSRSLAISVIQKQIARLAFNGFYWRKKNPSLACYFKESKQLIRLRACQQRLKNMCREFGSLFNPVAYSAFNTANPIVQLLGGYKAIMHLPEVGNFSVMRCFDAQGHLSFQIAAQDDITYELTISGWQRNVVAIPPGGAGLCQYNNTCFSSSMRQLPKVDRIIENKVRPLWSVTLVCNEIPRGKRIVAIGMQSDFKELQSLQDDDFDLINKLSKLVI